MALTVDEYKDIIRNTSFIKETIYDLGLRAFQPEFVDKILSKDRIAEFVTDAFQKMLAGEFYYYMDDFFEIETVDENGNDKSDEDIESEENAILDTLFGGYGEYEDSQYAGWFADRGKEAKKRLANEINVDVKKYLNVDAVIDEIVETFIEEHPNVLESKDVCVDEIVETFIKG